MTNDALVDCPLYNKQKFQCEHPDGDVLFHHPLCRGKLDFDFEVNYPMCWVDKNQTLLEEK